MGQEIIAFYRNQDKSYPSTNLYLNHNISLGYKDYYDYYDVDVDKILLPKKVIGNILLDIMMYIKEYCAIKIKNRKFLF